MIDDMVGKVGGQRILHASLIQGEVDPHSYELVKGDDEKFALADVVFYNGLGLEHGASLRHQLQRHPLSVALGEKIKEGDSTAIIIRNGHPDPHIWMDVSLWANIIDHIVVALSQADPAGTAYFEENGAAAKIELMKAHEEIVEKMRSIPPEKKYLVTSHDAFNYFTRQYLGGENWRTRFRAPEGLAPDGQLSCSDIQGIIDHLCQYRISVVFPESNVSKDSLKKIVSACREKGVDVKIAAATLHADALGEAGSDADTYLKMMDHNVKVLLDEWK
jgi:manganese/zinc/iron transport system substrate-binding protein